MLNSLFGEKIGMTQLFDQDKKVIGVSVIYFSDWVVTQIKKEDKEGYSAIQVGRIKKKNRSKAFSLDWLSNKKEYFSVLKEIALNKADEAGFNLGQRLDFSNISIAEGDLVKIAGTSIGRGYQGVVKRWGFTGGPSSHGSMFHRRPGAIGHMRTQGEVIKGTKLPGQHGFKRVTLTKLRVVKIDNNIGCLFVKGSVPGKKSTLLEISKQG